MSDNNNLINSGERLSFFKLFVEKEYKIEIPIIQRDYAQGRNSSSEVRERFLDALHSYLEENKPNRDLDFVYGSLIENGDTRFIPLDGQQRLTTLFLLHWYLANISDNLQLFRDSLASKKNHEGKEIYRSNFTYETRTSSREFCDELMSNEIDMDELLISQVDNKPSLSKTIQDCGWYYLSWENDPTIQSMLTMLDDIHVKFQNNPEFFDRLIDTENPIITFLFLNLKEFKLTDDLYIKMNARGKPLTTFENFKAKFEQHISEMFYSESAGRSIVFGDEDKSVSTQEYFSHKIDTSWANLLWNYRNSNGNDNSYDDELMNLIRVIVANEYATVSKKEKDQDLEFLIGTYAARKRKNYTDNLTYHIYEKLGVLTKNAITYLIDSLDALSNGNSNIHSYINDKFYFDEQEVFQKVLKLELTLPQRVQFHAYLKFLIHNKNNRDGIEQWMRVIHNLTENTVIDGADEVARATKAIESLLDHSNDILEYLKVPNNKAEFFLGRQTQEERIKAHLITKSEDWKNVVESIEQHSYLKGQIAFLLEFSGVLAYYEEHAHCNWSVEEDNSFIAKFRNYSNKADVVFNAIGTSLNKDFVWERAVLTKGDYLILASAWRRNLLTSSRNVRDYSWKRLLRLSPSGTKQEEANHWKYKRDLVKEVFDDPTFNERDFDGTLSVICNNPLGGWRGYFVKNPELIRYCEQGFIRFESASDIKLYKQSQQNHRHVEMYSYNIFMQNFFGKEILKPFKECWYYEVKSGDELSCVVLEDWTYQRKHFAMDVYYDAENKEFLTRFYKVKGNLFKTEYPSELESIVRSTGFEWDDEETTFGYTTRSKTEEETITLIKSLCSRLNNL
ncbi:DUF262 domain-containing protein [Labilibaculum sp. DW002]|uniref:DUF262 domain-containing protein n=1 Tax=Paralabilibaculum antarcticum TaxID=2912572 RepID=A0ABT5VSR9_9BACT|nr:DUF262 domain-containing protein [Labilibaculum sp. DW002]MDE5418474.1 DUF262 domain-containing protein [Labilibaculum sp. DW002]